MNALEREAVERFLDWLGNGGYRREYALCETWTFDDGVQGWLAEPSTVTRCLSAYDEVRRQQRGEYGPALPFALRPPQ